MTDWELDVRSRKSARYAIVVAACCVLVFVVLGVLLRTSATGVYFRLIDQLAMIGIGVLLASGVLLLARPRLRAGADGVLVRNAFGERRLDWDLVEGLSFPDGAAWARIELPDDEYIPVMAIQSNDREHAVTAVRSFRDLAVKYGPRHQPAATPTDRDTTWPPHELAATARDTVDGRGSTPRSAARRWGRLTWDSCPIPPPTAPRPERSRRRRACTSSAIPTAGSSTSARRRACGAG